MRPIIWASQSSPSDSESYMIGEAFLLGEFTIGNPKRLVYEVKLTDKSNVGRIDRSMDDREDCHI